MTPILERLTQVAAKIESVEGVAETLLAADAFLAYNLPAPDSDVDYHRLDPVKEHLSPKAPAMGKRRGSVRIVTELVGSGAAGVAPFWGKLLKACGFAETGTPGVQVDYDPVSLPSAIPSLTLGVYMGGVLVHKIWGARGRVSLHLAHNHVGLLDFTFTGADFSVTDSAFLAGVSYPTVQPPVFQGVTFTIDSYAAIINQLAYLSNNNVKLRESAGASSGHLAAVIVDKNPQVRFNPEAVAVASKDFFGNWRSQTTWAMSCALGSQAGNLITLTAPAVKLERLRTTSRNRMRQFDYNGLLCGVNGNDEIRFRLT